MKFGIIGLGIAIPEHFASQSESCDHAKVYNCHSERQEKMLEELYRRSTISKRHSVLITREGKAGAKTDFFPVPKNTVDKGPTIAQRMQMYHLDAIPLATQACNAALNDAGMDSAKVTHLVTVSCTGFSAPGFDLQLYETLPLNRDVQRTHIGFMGCHAAMNALRVAQGFCALDEKAVVLICATEICSLHFQYGWDRNDLLGNALFADGAGAMILRCGPGKIEYAASASYVIPDSSAAITWQIGDHGFTMTLSPQGAELIETYLPNLLSRWLEQYQLNLNQIATWAVHPGGPKILNTVQNCLNLSPSAMEPSRQVLAEYGNMSSPTVFFILQRLLAAGPAAPCLMLAFGPGMTIEAALFT